MHVTDVTSGGVKIGDEWIAANTVIGTTGVTASPVGAWLGAEVDWHGRVKLEPNLSVPGHPTIFVIGDTRCVTQKWKTLPGLSPVAMQEGRYAAKVIADRVIGKAQRRPFRYIDIGKGFYAQPLLSGVLPAPTPASVTSTEFQSLCGIEKIKVAPRLTRITRRRPSQWTLALFYQTAP